ncbi:MAG TPA: SgcJ/EcaC family oxidoreductase [Steroidobacteraceae bacterium]|nr:SgcJ/EcaC family oxidoreductase [Steroidobacteraceae bacterium]
MRRLRGVQFLAIVLVLALTACDRQPARVFPETAVKEWEAARNARDADAMAEVYTEDAKVLPPDAPVVEGRAAIRTFFRNLFEARPEPADFDEREIVVLGKYTWRQGIYSVPLADGTTEYGKFIQLWKLEKGEWKLYRSMWSPNGPPLPAMAGPATGE